MDFSRRKRESPCCMRDILGAGIAIGETTSFLAKHFIRCRNKVPLLLHITLKCSNSLPGAPKPPSLWSVPLSDDPFLSQMICSFVTCSMNPKCSIEHDLNDPNAPNARVAFNSSSPLFFPCLSPLLLNYTFNSTNVHGRTWTLNLKEGMQHLIPLG